MSAVLKPITQLLVKRPAFDNTNLGRDAKRWTSDNAGTLARYFHDLTLTLPAEEITETSEEDLRRWVMCQYELEIIYRDRARLPHGASL